MNKQERVEAAILSRPVDHVPVSIWCHFSAEDQDPVRLAEVTAETALKFDYDFVKMMPFGLYSVADLGAEINYFSERGKPPLVKKTGISKPSDYLKLARVDVTKGVYGRQLEFTERLTRLLPGDMPYIQTVFSPLTTLHKLAGDRVLADIKMYPEEVRHALGVITEITLDFVEENIKRGVSGFFFATQEARRTLLSLEDFRAFAESCDIAVQESYAQRTWFNVVHLHSLDVYFEEVAAKYPSNVLNWHDQHTFPSLGEARKITSKALLAGIAAAETVINGQTVRDDITLTGTPATITAAVRRAIASVDGKGLLIGPGCVVDQFAKEENLLAVRRAVEL